MRWCRAERRHAAHALAAGLALASLTPASGDDDLPPPLVRALAGHDVPATSVSALVAEAGTDRVLLAHRVDEPRAPASTIKLLTTYAALELLGPAYLWKTRVYLDGTLAQGRLRGDLVLQGGGDPFLVTESLWKLLWELRAKGVTHVDGDLVVDDTLFDVAAQESGDFDGRPYRAYNAGPSALLVNFRATRFVFFPEPGGGIRVFADPPVDALSVVNRVQAAAGPCGARQRDVRLHVGTSTAGTTVTFSGTYPRACGEWSLIRAVLPHNAYLLGAFRALWRDLGGSLRGGLRLAPTPGGARLVHTHESRPLGEIIRSINKFSNNVMARQMLLTLGAELQGPPGTTAKGAAAIRAWLDAAGIDMPALVMDNGSGRSRRARVSAAGLGNLLQAAYRSPTMSEFVASLPLAATDGSMSRRLRGEPLAGRAHVKTGLLEGVRALAGYVHAVSGRSYVVVLLLNHPGIHYGAGSAVQDALLRWVHEQ